MLKTSTKRRSPATGRVLVIWATLAAAVTSSLASPQPVEAVRPTVHPPSSIVNFGGATPPTGDDYVAISPGLGGGALALKADGSIVGWPAGAGVVSGIPAGNDFLAVAAGSYHGSALRADGSIVTWGSSNVANLLTGSPSGTGFVKIAASEFIGLALRADGSIVRWGDSSIAAVPPGNDFVDIAAGYGYALALRADGTIVGWGAAPSGAPTEGGFTDIAAGFEGCAMALRSDGSIATWGTSMGGFKFYAPTGAGFLDISVGRNCMGAALKSDGSVVRWAGPFGAAATVPGTESGSTFVDIAVANTEIYALVPAAPAPDTTPPAITISTPANGATIIQGSAVTVDFQCGDNVAVASCTGDLPDGAALVTSNVGTFGLTVQASDTSGNTSSATSVYTVVPPPPPSSAFLDRTVDFGGYSAFAVAVDHARNILYVTNYGGGVITALDATTLGLISTASTVSSPTSLDVDQTTGNIYIAHQGVGDRITVLNPSLVKIAEIPVTNPFSPVVNEVTHRAYFAQTYGGGIEVIDTTTNTKLTRVPTPGTSTIGVAIDPSRNLVFAVDRYANTMSIMDGATNTIITTVATGTTPSGVAVDEALDKVYVTNSNSNSVSVYRGSTGALLTTIPASSPNAVAVNSLDHHAYVTNSGSDTVSVIDTSVDMVVKVINSPTSQPWQVAVDPQAHAAYFTTLAGGSVARILDVPVDTTPPTVGITVPVDGGVVTQGSVVAVTYTCSDDRALASCVGDLPNGATLDTSTPGTFTFDVTATDAAGNSATVTHSYTIVDSIAPSIVFVSPTEGGAYDLGETVPVTYSCTDNYALASCVGDLPNGATLDTSIPGTSTFDVTAADTAGNQATATHTYQIEPTFAAGLGLTGSITSIPANYVVTVVDAADPAEGVTITVAGSGTDKVRLSVCGGFAVGIAPGSTVTLTCGSIKAVVHTGSVELVDPRSISTVQVPSGGAATLKENGDVVNGGVTPITVTSAGITQTVGAGGSSAWRATGFYAPVDMGGVWNSMKGGSTVPLKFEFFFGAFELTDPARVSLNFTRVQCTTGVEDAVEQFVTSTEAGITYVDGQFRANWKSPRQPGACYRVTVDGGGTSLIAYFKLK